MFKDNTTYIIHSPSDVPPVLESFCFEPMHIGDWLGPLLDAAPQRPQRECVFPLLLPW